ncbi:MAG TPA: YdcF family protein [Gaiellaceae bacterium]|nr:YdcF family protein [Gaiellaceae bacterium]
MQPRILAALAVLIAAWIVASLVLFVWPSAETGAPRHADVVVVLSGATDRLPPALALIRRGVAPVLAISSVGQTPKWLRAHRLCRAGHYAQARVLCFEATPYSTRGEAETIARLAQMHRWHSIVVVTSTYHVTRAHLLFSRCYSGKLSFVGAEAPWWVLPWEWATETGKLVVQETAERHC